MESASTLPFGVNMKFPFDFRSNPSAISSSVSCRNLSTLQQKLRRACAARARFAPCVSFHPSDFRSIDAVIGPKERDQCTRDNRRHFANAASQWSKPRSVRFPDNLCRASTRDYELIQNQDARNSRFRNARSRHLPGSPLSFRKILRLHPHPAEIRRERGAGKIPCPLRTSGSRSKYARVASAIVFSSVARH